MMSGGLRRTRGIGHDLQPGRIAIEVLKGIGIEELTASQEGTIPLGEAGFATAGVGAAARRLSNEGLSPKPRLT